LIKTGYDEFLAVVRNFKNLSALAVFAGGVVPFACYLAKIEPPQPPGVMLATVIVQLVALILAYQLTLKVRRRSANMIILALTFIWIAGSVLYISVFLSFTYTTPMTGEGWVKGFTCLPDINKMYPGQCPFLSTGILMDAQWDAFKLWTEWSISILATALALIWFGTFMALSGLIGSFLVFQMQQPAGRIGRMTAN
jgi:hypothetical protein